MLTTNNTHENTGTAFSRLRGTVSSLISNRYQHDLHQQKIHALREQASSAGKSDHEGYLNSTQGNRYQTVEALVRHRFNRLLLYSTNRLHNTFIPNVGYLIPDQNRGRLMLNCFFHQVRLKVGGDKKRVENNGGGGGGGDGGEVSEEEEEESEEGKLYNLLREVHWIETKLRKEFSNLNDATIRMLLISKDLELLQSEKGQRSYEEWKSFARAAGATGATGATGDGGKRQDELLREYVEKQSQASRESSEL